MNISYNQLLQIPQPQLRLSGSCPLPISEYPEILLGHGSGGKLSHRLIEQRILPRFSNKQLNPMHDGAVIDFDGTRLAFSTDSFVIDPIFFPGGNIGQLAIHGTINDIAMCGARPHSLSVAFIIEEGLPMTDFERIMDSMRHAADKANVALVTGDTKVVNRGQADRLFINTSGIGVVEHGIDISPSRAKPGDHVLVSGPIATHGIAIMSAREGLEFETEIHSDSAPLNSLVASMLDAVDVDAVHVLRDPTRGGLTSALTEIAETSQTGICLQESCIPVREDVKGACEILGLDPLHVANEGILTAIVAAEYSQAILAAMQAHPLGKHAADIGKVVDQHHGMVTMQTNVGGTRVVDMLSGEQLPRIC